MTRAELVTCLAVMEITEPVTPEYDNDVGPDDGGFWEWWSVAGIRFEGRNGEAKAGAFAELVRLILDPAEVWPADDTGAPLTT